MSSADGKIFQFPVKPLAFKASTDKIHWEIYLLSFFFIASVTMLIAIPIANRTYKKAISFQEESHELRQKIKQIIANMMIASTISLIRFFVMMTYISF